MSIWIVSCGGETYYNVAIYYAKKGDCHTAIEYFSKAIEKNPTDAKAYFNRGHCQHKLGGKAIQVMYDYSKAIEFNPNDHQAYMNRGVMNSALGNYEESMNDYSKSIEIEPDYPIVYENLGNLYELKSDTTLACENWKKSLEMGNDKVSKRIDQTCN